MIQAGTYRGAVLDRGLGTSTNGFPQLVLQVRTDEQWDENSKVWTTCEPQETTGYITLVGGNDKATKGAQQAMRALGWDGAAWSDLQLKEDLADKVQFRMEDHEWEGKTSTRLNWIAGYDDNPSRSVTKLDPNALRSLDAKYSGQLKAIGGGPKPKTASPTPPKPRAADPTPAASTATPASGDVPTAPSAAKPKGRPPKPTAKPPLSRDDAWNNVIEPKAVAAGKTETEITQAWTSVVGAKGGDEAITDWAPVADEILKTLGIA